MNGLNCWKKNNVHDMYIPSTNSFLSNFWIDISSGDNGEYFNEISNSKEEYLNRTKFEEMFSQCPYCKPHGTGNISGLKRFIVLIMEYSYQI